MHRQDDPWCYGVEQGWDVGIVDRRRASGGRQDDVGSSKRRQLAVRERMAEIAQKNQVQVFGAEMNDRHCIFGQARWGLENRDRLDSNAPEDAATARQFQCTDHVKRRHDLPCVAMVAVVFVTDDNEVGRVCDRLVATRVGRSIRVEDDREAIGLNPKRRVAIPGDPHDGASLMPPGNLALRSSQVPLDHNPRPDGCVTMRTPDWPTWALG
jgi:hypothetical protein